MKILNKAEILELKEGDEILVINQNEPYKYEKQTVFLNDLGGQALFTIAQWGVSKQHVQGYKDGSVDDHGNLERCQTFATDFYLRENGVVYRRDPYDENNIKPGGYFQYAKDVSSADLIKLDNEDPLLKPGQQRFTKGKKLNK